MVLEKKNSTKAKDIMFKCPHTFVLSAQNQMHEHLVINSQILLQGPIENERVLVGDISFILIQTIIKLITLTGPN